jgi:hypothetical protein
MGLNEHISTIRRMKIGLLIGLFSLSPILSTPVNAAEQTESSALESILISPGSKRYELKQGEERTDSLRVVNDGTSTFDFNVYARPYSVNDEAYVPDFTAEPKNADAYKWVKFDKTSFRLEPGESTNVEFAIRVPANAAPGGHYGVLFAETQPSDDGGAVVRKKRVGSILYVTVDGNVTTGGQSVGASVPFFQFNPPLQASERIRNTGNTDFTVTSDIEVADIFGAVKHKATRESVVLPDSTRRIESNWSSPAWMGLYKVTMTTKFLDKNETSSHHVLLVPVWVYATLGLLIGARILYAVAHRKKK